MFDDWNYDFLWGQSYFGVLFYVNPKNRFAVIDSVRDWKYREVFGTYKTYRAAEQALRAVNVYSEQRHEILDIKTGHRSIY